MSEPQLNRRQFVGALGAVTIGAAVGRAAERTAVTSHDMDSKTGSEPVRLPLACNQYPWVTLYRREGRRFEDDLDASIDEIARCGTESLEPLFESEDMVDPFADRMERHGLQMYSLYMNSTLHEPDQAKASIDKVVRVSTRAQSRMGTRIVVTNPSPIEWHSSKNKTDEQMLSQGEALNALGAALRKEGLTLAYHSHDSEMRKAAREFHHMLGATDPKNVKFCLDAHWVFRGSGDSSVALFDIIELYADRIVELHARQSSNGVWTETFGEGDIDYERLTRAFEDKGIRPLITVEQEVEELTPKTMSGFEAQKISHERARETFAPLLSQRPQKHVR